jgi:hypothetical protein
MAKIENIHQLRAEIARMEGVCKQQEDKLRRDLQQLKEDFNPLNILMKTISSFTGVKLDRNAFMKDGIGFGLSLFFQRFILKAEKVVESKVYDFVDTAVEKIRKFMSKVVDPSERRRARMDEEDEKD